jgi:hypothetical protein
MKARHNRSAGQIFLWPALIATATLTALAFGLCGDHSARLLCWVLLAAPLGSAIVLPLRRG